MSGIRAVCGVGEWGHAYSREYGSHAIGIGVDVFPGSEQGVQSTCVP